jgi:hypothetical protein
MATQTVRQFRPERPWRATLAAALLLLGLEGCERVERVPDRFRDMTPYEAYLESLSDAGLAETALAREWIRAGTAAMASPAPVSLPFEEEGWIAIESPTAMAYRLSVPRGQKLTAEVTLSGEKSTRLFVDLFRVADDGMAPLRPVLSTDSVPGTFTHEPWRGGDFVLRLQPELLRGGRYRVKLRLVSQLAFPLDGYDIRAVQSIFGAERDGGARSHDGVDIFARRGTPVIAAAPGRAYGIEITNRGGKVVWVRDNVRNARLYYAHLDSQAVTEGQLIQIGDTLGFVGNTGNARTTPPHLHFGLYRSGQGAVDPVPFLRPPRGTPPLLMADLDRLGSWVQPSADGIQLRAGPADDAPVVRQLDSGSTGRVLGGSGAFYRVALHDGVHGYVAARHTAPATRPGRPTLPAADDPTLVQQ